MGLLLILPLLVSGYIFCGKNLLIRYRLHQYDGQLLYFHVALYGLVCFFIAFAIAALGTFLFSRAWPSGCIGGSCGICWPEFSTDYIKAISDLLVSLHKSWSDASKIYSFFIVVGILTLLVPYLLSSIVIKFYGWRQGKRLGRKIDADELEAFILRDALAYRPLSQSLLEAAASTAPVMVVMDDRKFYVGTVSSIGIPTEASGADDDFGIKPFMGGYCDKDTLELVVDPRYSEDITLLEGKGEDSVKWSPNFILKQNSIVSFVKMPALFDKESSVPFPHRLVSEGSGGSMVGDDSKREVSDLLGSSGRGASVGNALAAFLSGFLTFSAIKALRRVRK
ncbi:hypothetical protein [Stenotrophomonas sepilia]